MDEDRCHRRHSSRRSWRSGSVAGAGAADCRPDATFLVNCCRAFSLNASGPKRIKTASRLKSSRATSAETGRVSPEFGQNTCWCLPHPPNRPHMHQNSTKYISLRGTSANNRSTSADRLHNSAKIGEESRKHWSSLESTDQVSSELGRRRASVLRGWKVRVGPSQSQSPRVGQNSALSDLVGVGHDLRRLSSAIFISECCPTQKSVHGTYTMCAGQTLGPAPNVCSKRHVDHMGPVLLSHAFRSDFGPAFSGLSGGRRFADLPQI